MKNISLLKSLEIEDIISHYTNINTAVENILFTGCLRVSSLQKTNDPFEYLEIPISYGGTVDIFSHKKEQEQIKQFALKSIQTISDSVKRLKIACFCRNDIEEINNGSYFDGFGFSRPRMWAQYGESHKGCCLLFTKKKLIENISKKSLTHYHREVRYYNSVDLNKMFPHGSYDGIRKLGESEYLKSLKKQFINKYIFTKHSDFENENEYRIVLDTESDEPEYISINNCIFGIVISEKISKFHEKYLKEYSKRNDIPLIIISWDRRKIAFDSI